MLTSKFMDYGKKIGDGTPSEVRNNQAVIDAYLGVSHDWKICDYNIRCHLKN